MKKKTEPMFSSHPQPKAAHCMGQRCTSPLSAVTGSKTEDMACGIHRSAALWSPNEEQCHRVIEKVNGLSF